MLLPPHLKTPCKAPFFPLKNAKSLLNKSLGCSDIDHYTDTFILFIPTF